MQLLSITARLSLLAAHAGCSPASLVRGAAAELNTAAASLQALGKDWSGWGGNIYNNRWASGNTAVTSSGAGNFNQHCRLTYHLGVSATPTVRNDMVYYPTFGGRFVALNYKTCQVQWDISVGSIITQFAPLSPLQAQLTGLTSRSSPQIDGNVVYFTTSAHALLVAVDRNTGATLGFTQINSHPLAVSSVSPTLYKGLIFVGASSSEEVAAAFVPGYPCCSFIGNVAAFSFKKGQFTLQWNVDMLPSGQGWSGGAVWGSQPSIDTGRSQVFIATGNTYDVPPEYEECVNQGANITAINLGLVTASCIPPNIYQESVLALDVDTGHINWVRQLSPLDSFTLACGSVGGGVPRNPALCPGNPGIDADFGMAPTFVSAKQGSTPRGQDTVVVGQKNGILHAMSAQAGTPFWATATSPSGSGGGLMWGIAVDETQVYFTAVNSDFVPWKPYGSTETITRSGFGAARLVDGSLVWEVPSPLDGGAATGSLVPPSVVNDIVLVGYTGSNITGNFADYVNTPGALMVLNKATGATIKSYTLDAQFHGGIAIQDRYIMFGSGYAQSQRYNGTGSFYVWQV